MRPNDTLFSRQEFLEASAEELRALAVLLCRGRLTAKELSALASISLARAKGALALWEECGVHDTGIEDVYEVRVRPDEVADEDRRVVAKTIRSESLSSLLDACAALLNKPTLNDLEIKIITGLYSQYGISEEYIYTLLSDICARPSRPTVKKLESEAIRHVQDGIDTVEALSEFFHHRDSVSESERLVRRALHIGRALSPSEKKYAERWVMGYGYGEEMLLYAYDCATASTQSPTLKYLDAILSDWHGGGVKTVSEAKSYRESNKNEKKQASKKKKEAPRYGNFDPDEAFRLALERSYGAEQGEGEN